MMTNAKHRCWLRVIIAVVLALPLLWYGGDRINYHYRQKWPRNPPEHMLDLPPLDRTNWPKTPVEWKTETVETEIVTPEGIKRTPITYHINSIGMKLVKVEAGTFQMGLPEREQWRLPKHDHARKGYLTAHLVTLTRGYYLGAHEVTNEQFELFKPNHRRPPYQVQQAQKPEWYRPGPELQNNPAQPVTWRESQEFCRWLSAKEGRLYRLPTEAEWEYACKAGTTTRVYWGDNVWNRNYANKQGKEDGFNFTAPVGIYPANAWGFYDMIGNAREWVQDWFGPFQDAPATDPKGPATGRCRVGKGGGWNSSVEALHSGWRDGDAPHDLKDIHGFRVLCEAE